MPQSLNRFLRAAAAGNRDGCSHGELICNRVAKLLLEIGDDFALLDFGLREGAAELMEAMAGPWATDADKLAIFDAAYMAAAGKKPRTE